MDAHSGSTSSWDYLDFELEIRGGGPREYPVSVRSPAGEARAEMRFPFDEWELKDRLQSLEIALLRSGGTRRRMPTPEEHTVQDFGRGLFESLLIGDVRTRYEMSLSEARRQEKGLRLKLRIQPSELAVLPWEFLYDSERDRYPCLSSNTPLVRYLDLPQPVEPLRVSPPLRILGMVTSPMGLDPLDVEHEKRLVEEATKGLREGGLLELTWLEGQTWRHLQRAMRRGPWHIFHFVGHGGFDPATEEGALALSNDAGHMRLLRATGLAELLDDHYPLRLVFLNSCEGAKGSESDAFSSTAATLVRRGVPAVVAMQYEITDTAAIEFSRDFYDALADGLPVDAAVTEARTAVSMDSILEWGTPVLYMHSPDGRVFDIANTAVHTHPTSETEDRQEENALDRYREGVELAWTDGKLEANEVQRLRDLANNELRLSLRAAADIEREVMGDTIETILERQEEAAKQEHRSRRLEELYSQARRLHRDRKWQEVIDLLAQIHSEDSNYPDPEGLLASSSDALKLEQRVVTLYARGQRYMKAEERQQALESFEEVQRLKPGYRDTKEMLSRVRRELAQPPTVDVPDLAGQRASQARSRLANEGLKLGAQNKVANGTIPEGQIIEQSPEAGAEVEAGSFVRITVSSGPQKVARQEHRNRWLEELYSQARRLHWDRKWQEVRDLIAPSDRQVGENTNRAQRVQSLLPALAGSWWAMVLRGLLLIVFGLALFVFELVLPGPPWHQPFRLYSALILITYGAIAAIDATTRASRRRPLLNWLQGTISGLVGLFVLSVWFVGNVLADPNSFPYSPGWDWFDDNVLGNTTPVDFEHLDTRFEAVNLAGRLVGSWAIFIGIIHIIAPIQLRWEAKNLWLIGASGVSLTIFGSLLLLSDPYRWDLLAILMLVSGIALIAVALQVRDR
jgi:uncharacterized membrane protein HdeD (DUF308 family)